MDWMNQDDGSGCSGILEAGSRKKSQRRKGLTQAPS